MTVGGYMSAPEWQLSLFRRGSLSLDMLRIDLLGLPSAACGDLARNFQYSEGVVHI